jgi:hypothetical protein
LTENRANLLRLGNADIQAISRIQYFAAIARRWLRDLAHHATNQPARKRADSGTLRTRDGTIGEIAITGVEAVETAISAALDRAAHCDTSDATSHASATSEGDGGETTNDLPAHRVAGMIFLRIAQILAILIERAFVKLAE